MKKQYYIIISAFILLLLKQSNTGYSQTGFYSIKPKGISVRIYSEDISHYLLSSTDKNFFLPDTPFQKVISKKMENNNIFLIIKCRKTGRKGKAIKSAQYLQNTRFLNLLNKEIISIAKKFHSSRNAIQDIEKFVYSYINRKAIGIPIIPAVNILKSRSGDCTEHTILVISILRSLKIPSRACVGMILCRNFEGQKNVFVFHMWAEAYNGSRWVLVDATRPGAKHPNRYVAFAYHHLKTAMPLAYLRAAAAIKNLTISYLKR